MIARLICWWQGHTPPHAYWVTSQGIGRGKCCLCGTDIWADLRTRERAEGS